MAWNNPDDLIVAGDGQVFVAPVGTALPTSGPTAALNSAFKGLGYHTEDGASFSAEPDLFEVPAWQSRRPIRRDFQGQELTVSFTLLQWDEDTVPFAFGGGAIVDLGSGNYRYDFPEDTDSLDERALILDVADGDKKFRFVFPRGNVTEGVESQFQRGEAAGLPVTWSALDPSGGSAGYVLMNSAAFAAGS